MSLDQLDKQKILRRIPNLTIRLESDNSTWLQWTGGEMTGRPGSLTVLELFSRPKTVEAALSELQTRAQGGQDWIDLTSSLMELYRQGVLTSDLTPTLIQTSGGFDGAALHTAMLNDRERTSRFIEAVHQTVRPGDVVLDIGTGSGVLAMAAVQAGASKVFAIEATSFASISREMFRANGVADRVQLVEGWSTQITLPTLADVVVSEILGDDGLGENVLEILRDAQTRLLKPNARSVPTRINIMGIPLQIPPAKLDEVTFTDSNTSSWSEWYDLDFNSLPEVARQYPPLLSVNTGKIATWLTLGDPVTLATVDLSNLSDTALDTETSGSISLEGALNGYCLFFEAELTSGNWLSTDPRLVTKTNSWQSSVHLIPEPISVAPGDRYSVKYSYHGLGTGVSAINLTMLNSD